MGKENLEKWLNGEYVSPQEFKDSVKEAIKRIGILERIYKTDVKYYMEEVKQLHEERSRDGFKIAELETAIKIKDNVIQNLGARLENEFNDLKKENETLNNHIETLNEIIGMYEQSEENN